MRSIMKTAAVVTGIALATAIAVPAQAAALDHRYDNSGVSFSISFGASDYDSRYHNRYRHNGHYYNSPRQDYWGRYPSYGYGYKTFPGYEHVRRNYNYHGNACYWRVSQENYHRRNALVKSLVCYDRYGRSYTVRGSQQVVRYTGYDRGRQYGYDAGYRGYRH